jgi:nucleoside-diphosphate-sugar epimerase
MSRRSLLVTGAGGALGAFLVPAFQRAGWKVRALVHRRPVAAADESIPGDVRDPGAVESAVAGVDAVVHAAAVTHARDVRHYVDVNVGGTEVVVRAARRVGIHRFLLVSSRAITEGGGAYSNSKRRSEEVVWASGLSVTVVRLPEVYGAGSREGIDRFVAAARAGRSILVPGTGSDLISPLYVADAVSALVRALESREAAGKTYTLAGPTLTLHDAAQACRAAFASRSRIVRVPEPIVRAAVRLSRILPLPLCPDQLDRLRAVRPAPSPEAEADLGFRPRAFAEGLFLLRSGA